MQYQGPVQTQSIFWKTGSCSTNYASLPKSNANDTSTQESECSHTTDSILIFKHPISKVLAHK